MRANSANNFFQRWNVLDQFFDGFIELDWIQRLKRIFNWMDWNEQIEIDLWIESNRMHRIGFESDRIELPMLGNLRLKIWLGIETWLQIWLGFCFGKNIIDEFQWIFYFLSDLRPWKLTRKVKTSPFLGENGSFLGFWGPKRSLFQAWVIGNGSGMLWELKKVKIITSWVIIVSKNLNMKIDLKFD